MKPEAVQWRPLWFSLVIVIVWLVGPAWGQEGPAGVKPDQDRYLKQLRGQREEGWWQREMRQFRSYPHLDRAYKLMQAGQLPEARAKLEKFLAIDPKDFEARFNYLIILFKLKDYPETIRQADLILQGRPRFGPALLYRAMARQGQGRLAEAQEDLRTADQTELSPEDRRLARNLMADLALRQQQYSQALAQLEALAQAPPDFSLSYRRGLALEGLGRLDEAKEAYRQALDQSRDPRDRLRAYRALGELARKQQDLPAAMEAFQAAEPLEPNNPQLFRTLAELAYARKDYAGSAQWIRRALAIRATPQDREFLINILGFSKDYPAVTQELQQLLADSQTPEERFLIHTALGQAYTRWGKMHEASQAFQEAARIKDDLPTLEALAQTREREGRFGEAIRVYRDILQRQPSAQISLKLGLLLDKTGNREGALPYLQRAAAGNLPGHLKVMAYKQMGAIYYQLGRYEEARLALEQAAALHPKDPHLYQTLAETALKLNAPDQALAYQKQALELQHQPEAAGGILEGLGFTDIRLGRYQEAADYFRQAIAAGRDSWELRQNLGITLYKLKKWEEAREQFRLALNQRHDPQTLVYLGLVFKELHKPGLAVHYLILARDFEARLEKTMQLDLLNALGYLYAEEGEYAQAERAYSQSLRLKDDPLIAICLAKMQRRLGQSQEALETLEAIDLAGLTPPQQAERLEEMAANWKIVQQPEKALDALTQANRIESSPSRDYRLGLTYQELKKPQEALPYLQQAVSQEPGSNQYKVALGYANLAQKNYGEAGRLFEEVLRRDPDYLKLYEELGYVNMKSCNNDEAVAWFKRAIDNKPFYPVHSPEEEEQLRQDIYRFRKEVSKITNRFDFTAYLSYQTAKAGQSVAPGGLLGGGALPSQGGVEFAYQPPVIGFRDERIFQVFTRILWNIVPRSMRFDPDSFQGGVGLRYKPLKTQNLYLWGERLYKIGDKSLDDWLLRVLYSWDYGYDLKPGRPWWDYTYLFADLAYFAKAPGTWAYYGEFRQGVTFNVNDTFLITPHLVADFRYQDPLTTNSSYLEGGVGVSFKYLFLETHYEVHRASFEVLAYYKHGNFLNRTFAVSGSKYDGFFLTGIFHF